MQGDFLHQRKLRGQAFGQAPPRPGPHDLERPVDRGRRMLPQRLARRLPEFPAIRLQPRQNLPHRIGGKRMVDHRALPRQRKCRKRLRKPGDHPHPILRQRCR